MEGYFVHKGPTLAGFKWPVTKHLIMMKEMFVSVP